MASVEKKRLENEKMESTREGTAVKENAEDRLKESKEGAEALDIEGRDEESAAIIQEARNEGQSLAEMLIENEIETPRAELVGKLEGIANEANEHAKYEGENAKKAEGITGVYSEIGKKAGSGLEKIAEEYSDIGAEAETSKDEIDKELLKKRKEIMELW